MVSVFVFGLMLALEAGAAQISAPYETDALFVPANQIDICIQSAWRQRGIQPANLCPDEVFIRRVYLDVIGTLPEPSSVKDFLADGRPNKRAVLIDSLLQREEFADYWAMKWSDILRVKAEFPINLWPNAVQAYHRWVRDAIREQKPYDQFARELLTASGSNFRDPPVNFYRAMQNREPPGIASSVALTFMGTRLEKWPTDQRANLAEFFSRVAYKTTGEWKEEIVYLNPAATEPLDVVFPDGRTVQIPAGDDPRRVFANWLCRPRNPWFARNIVNRTWSWLLGRGIVQEPDDFRDDNPPSNPELLAYLERELITSHFDLKHIYWLILNSHTYQLSAIPRSNHPEAAAQFASYPVRRLEAEVLIDALCQITGTTEEYSSAIPEPYTFIPASQRAIELADGSISSQFLELFGRSSRDTGLETERNNRSTSAQALHLLNSSHIQRKLEQSSKLRALMQSKKGQRDSIRNLYLAILSRNPTDEEMKTVSEYKSAGNVNVDLAWALINTSEFQCRH